MDHDYIHPHPPIHRAAHVANYFLGKTSPIKPTALCHLVQLAHGWHLAIHQRPLFTEAVRTHSFGPYVPELWWLLAACGNSRSGRKRLPERREELPKDLAFLADQCFPKPDQRPEVFTKDQKKLLDTVHETYAHLPPARIPVQLHAEDSPWAQVRATLGDDQLIDNGLQQAYFTKLARKQEAPSSETQTPAAQETA